MDLSCKEFCICLFVRQYDNKSYERLKEQQQNAFLMGDNKYTERIVEAKTLLKDCQGPSIVHPALIVNK